MSEHPPGEKNSAAAEVLPTAWRDEQTSVSWQLAGFALSRLPTMTSFMDAWPPPTFRLFGSFRSGGPASGSVTIECIIPDVIAANEPAVMVPEGDELLGLMQLLPHPRTMNDVRAVLEKRRLSSDERQLVQDSTKPLLILLGHLNAQRDLEYDMYRVVGAGARVSFQHIAGRRDLRAEPPMSPASTGVQPSFSVKSEQSEQKSF